MSDEQPVLACNLDALSADERARRAVVAARVSARFREVRETQDGYAARLDPDRDVVHDAPGWILLDVDCSCKRLTGRVSVNFLATCLARRAPQ